MATLHTRRLIVVIREGLRAGANLAGKDVDAAGGERTFTVALRRSGDATNAVVARWCSWAMQPAEVTALRDRLQARGATAAECVVVTAAERGTFVPVASARAYLFDARDGAWAPAEVLAALSLDTPAGGGP